MATIRSRGTLILSLLAATLGSGACAVTFDARTLGATTSMSSPPGATPAGEEFRITRKAVFLLWGLTAASRPSLERVLSGQISQDQQVANLRIRVRSRFGDLVATALTLGLVVPRSVTYEGVIVRPAPAPAPAP
jgi:hypothetical protein